MRYNYCVSCSTLLFMYSQFRCPSPNWLLLIYMAGTPGANRPAVRPESLFVHFIVAQSVQETPLLYTVRYSKCIFMG